MNLPLLQGPNGMPIGVQLVADQGDDARLMRTARWLVESRAAWAGPGNAPRTPQHQGLRDVPETQR